MKVNVLNEKLNLIFSPSTFKNHADYNRNAWGYKYINRTLNLTAIAIHQPSYSFLGT
jgi:hypothetical protein